PIVYEKARSINGVIVLGHVKEEHLTMLLQGADALIYPSLHEGFGLPLVETMACGVPVITSNVFSPPEVADGGGLFVDPYDVADITNKMIEMSTNESLRKELSKNAYKRSKMFSWRNVADNLLKLIEKHAVCNSDKFDFAESLDIAAYRTLTTVCQMTPQLYSVAVRDLLDFNYSRIISWSLDVGLDDPNIKDFLIPFKDWLVSHN
ncbi:MAG: glycosyltransferase, partial [Nitrosopumilaceae archaeon]